MDLTQMETKLIDRFANIRKTFARIICSCVYLLHRTNAFLFANRYSSSHRLLALLSILNCIHIGISLESKRFKIHIVSYLSFFIHFV